MFYLKVMVAIQIYVDAYLLKWDGACVHYGSVIGS